MTVKNEKQLLENAETPQLRKARNTLIAIMDKAISSVDPSAALNRELEISGTRLEVGTDVIDLSDIERIFVVGGGKASGNMGKAIEKILGKKIEKGIINVPEETASQHQLQKIELVAAGHPIPNRGSAKGTEEMINLVKDLTEKDLVICLLSGGGSALMVQPADDISLDELQKTNQLLLKSGASIQEINAVRKHISEIKGGQLAREAFPAKVVTLIISDVVGDRLDTIASGPTYPDSTTYSEAWKVVKKYELVEEIPKSVAKRLKSGLEGRAPETPAPEKSRFSKSIYEIIAGNRDAIEAAERVGGSRGFNVTTLTKSMQEEAKEVGEELAKVAKKVLKGEAPVKKPAILLSGGETTVTVEGEGKGGRNQELALSAVKKISCLENVTVASFSTDGIDGPTDAAGAVADGFTLEKSESLGLDSEDYLRRNDSYNFFKELGDLLITGPTGTNVMDVACLIVS